VVPVRHPMKNLSFEKIPKTYVIITVGS